MIEFVILLGVIGGWIIVASTLFLMLALGKTWGLAGVLLLVAAIQINHWLKEKYMHAIVDATPRAKAIAAHIFEMNELILLSSYLVSLLLYEGIQKYVEIIIKFPGMVG
ncbi:hypothetical protein [Thermococcus camini]|uniref:Uncharacterized protein n=1 Tax=Thermococcus camini TaxID=2016373 RepID=A0A7G2D9H2_9EURY|nr:hypothetical protein [Thermococcus camini]CAD5244638.1 conserved protein of unknown function [Thermococcus camini]